MRDGTVDMRVNNLCRYRNLIFAIENYLHNLLTLFLPAVVFSLHEERGISVRPHSETNTESKVRARASSKIDICLFVIFGRVCCAL